MAIGGIGVGLVSLSGLAVAVYAMGGFAAGVYSLGGLALGWHAAVGGGAIAGEYGVGGAVLAEHANDSVAREYMRTSLMRYGNALLQHSRWFIVLAFLPAIMAYLNRRESRKRDGRQQMVR